MNYTKKIFLCLFTLFFVCCSGASGKELQIPPLEARVTDLAGLVSAQEKEQLENFLAAYETQTGHQLAVLTVPSLEEESLEDYTIRVVEKWQLGKKGKDDGILLFIALQERKMRIEVGYGLEPFITDSISGDIIREQMAPNFKNNLYFDGIYQALAKMMFYINKGEGRDTNIPGLRVSSGNKDSDSPSVASIIIIIIVLMIIGSSRDNNRWRRRGYSEPFWGGFGGGSSGGGFSSGGFSGGGGGFGGGGASGSW